MRTFEQVAADVFVATARRDATSTTVLVAGSEALLVDPSWDPDELAGTVEWLRSRNIVVRAGFATHAHHDHVLWHPDFGAGPRWASAVTAQRAHDQRADLIAALGPGWSVELTALVGDLTPIEAQRLPWPHQIELVRHDAHTPGHTALWLPGSRVLIAGDMLSDIEPPLPEETGPAEYLAGLQLLLPYVERCAVVVPGHGHPGTDAMTRWRRDLTAVRAMISGSDPDLEDGFDLDR